MKNIKSLILASVAAIALFNNANAEELLIDSTLLESEVKQELQINLDDMVLSLDVTQQALQLISNSNTQGILLANNLPESNIVTQTNTAE